MGGPWCQICLIQPAVMPPGASRILLRGQLTLTLGVNPNVNTNPRPLSFFYGRTTKWFETLEHLKNPGIDDGAGFPHFCINRKWINSRRPLQLALRWNVIKVICAATENGGKEDPGKAGKGCEVVVVVGKSVKDARTESKDIPQKLG